MASEEMSFENVDGQQMNGRRMPAYTISSPMSLRLRWAKNIFQRCPKFWPLAPPWGMDPGVRSHGMKANPPRYLWSKYECFLMSGRWDIPPLEKFNVKLWSNSTNGSESRMDERTNERTNIPTERRKLYTLRHKCRGYNEMAVNANFHFFHYKSMATLSCHSTRFLIRLG